jgi:hypothetical protein
MHSYYYRLMVLVAAVAACGAGCAVWYPHSVVASDRPVHEAVFTGERVRGRVCGRYIVGIPIGPHAGSIDELMEQLHALAPQAIAFQDLRFDEIVSWYVVYTERCLEGSAQPLMPVPIMLRRPATAAPSAPAAAPPPSATPEAPRSPHEQLEQELLAPPSAK